MTELFFLPKGYLAHSTLLWFGVLVLVSMLAGELAARWFRLPRIVGFVVAGIGLGPEVSGLIDRDMLFELRVFLNIAMGMILFELGQRVNLGWLRNNPWLLGSSLLEAALSFLGVAAVLLILEVRPLIAATAAAIAMGTSPAVVMSVSKDLRAQGQVTERLLLLTALNSVYAFLAVTMLFAWLHLEYRGGWAVVLLHPAYLLVGALALAAVLAAVTLSLLGSLGRRVDAQFVAVIAMVLLAVALAQGLKLSVVLTLLSFGAMTRALDRERRFVSLNFGRLGLLFMVVLFSLTGANLDFAHLETGALAALAVVAVRALGKGTAMLVLARQSGISMRKASLIAVGLTPMSGVALVLMQDFYALYPGFGPQLSAVMVSSVTMLELAGPLAVHFAIGRAQEAAVPDDLSWIRSNSTLPPR
jgi:Kef-type K+ transport system membrane component KefB